MYWRALDARCKKNHRNTHKCALHFVERNWTKNTRTKQKHIASCRYAKNDFPSFCGTNSPFHLASFTFQWISASTAFLAMNFDVEMCNIITNRLIHGDSLEITLAKSSSHLFFVVSFSFRHFCEELCWRACWLSCNTRKTQKSLRIVSNAAWVN